MTIAAVLLGVLIFVLVFRALRRMKPMPPRGWVAVNNGFSIDFVESPYVQPGTCLLIDQRVIDEAFRRWIEAGPVAIRDEDMPFYTGWMRDERLALQVINPRAVVKITGV